jgi:hypothetical protein
VCLALSKPAGKKLEKAAMQRAYTANHDGCGFAVRIKGQVLIEKGLWSFEEFWARILPYMQYDAIIHFRMASMGTVNAENCHPFALVGGGALIHNGHMQAYGTLSQSDTSQWVEHVLNPLLRTYPDALSQPTIQTLLADSIGYSKMVLLTAKDTLILNEETGHAKGGIWYSNRSYQAPKPVTPDLTWGGTLTAQTGSADLETDENEDVGEEWCESCYYGTGRHVVCTHCLNSMEERPWNR